MATIVIATTMTSYKMNKIICRSFDALIDAELFSSVS